MHLGLCLVLIALCESSLHFIASATPRGIYFCQLSMYKLISTCGFSNSISLIDNEDSNFSQFIGHLSFYETLVHVYFSHTFFLLIDLFSLTLVFFLSICRNHLYMFWLLVFCLLNITNKASELLDDRVPKSFKPCYLLSCLGSEYKVLGTWGWMNRTCWTSTGSQKACDNST